ncbi:MAG: ABC transporter substrate-binding protein [Chloroflexi bacterium]|nr:ABC transporter substrate-binding protein [Chloroflexota bacterium]
MRSILRMATWLRKTLFTRGSFLGGIVAIGLVISVANLLGCAAPATPTATPAPTAAAPKTAATTAAAPTVAPKAATPAAATPAAAAPKSLKTVTFASTTGAMGLTSALIQKMGLDAKYGLKLDVKSMDPTATEKAIALRQIDAGNFSLLSAVNSTNQDIPTVVFAPVLYNHISVIVWKDSPYRSMADLKGKKIASPEKAGGAYTSAQVLARELGGDFEKDYQIITGPIAALPPYLERKDVEAILIHEPVASGLILSGNYRRLMAYTEEWQKLTGQPMFMNGIAAHRSWVEQNRDTAAALTKIMIEAHSYIRKNPEVFEQNKDVLGLKSADAVKMAQERMPAIYPDRWDNELVQNAKHIVDRAVELKITAPPKQDIFWVP